MENHIFISSLALQILSNIYLNKTLSCYCLYGIVPSFPSIFQIVDSSRRMIFFVLFLLSRVAQPQTLS